MDFLKGITSVFKAAGGAVQDAVGVVAEKRPRSALTLRLAATTTTICATPTTR